ncbi:MAG: ATP-binding protein [Lachnospiraceae bacterium]|nr:ATP-binding protein [Lachnospiraceae bacterium]
MKRLAAVAAIRLSEYFSDRGEETVFSRYPKIVGDLPEDFGVYEAEEQLFHEAVSWEDPFTVTDPETTLSGQRLSSLIAVSDDGIVRTFLELTALCLIEPAAKEILDLVSPGNGNGVTILTAALVSGLPEGIDRGIFRMQKADEMIRLLFGEPEDTTGEFYRAVYTPDRYLTAYLGGCAMTDPGFSDFAKVRDLNEELPACYGMEEEVSGLSERVERLFESRKARGIRSSFTVLISGEKESGRYTAAAIVAAKNALSLLAVDFSYLLGTSEPREVFRRLIRTCLLENRALVVRNIVRSKDTVFLIDRMRELYDRYVIFPLFLLTEPEVKLLPSLGGEVLTMKIPGGAAPSLLLWKNLLPEELKGLAPNLSSKMMLTAGQVRRVVKALNTAAAVGEVPDERMICRLCYEVLDDGRYENIKRVEPGFSLDDLKIDPHNRSVLEDICHQVELRYQVYDGWGLKKKYAYGRCVSVILAGPPGTGKTMTVHALAGQLGLELYKVDLSQIVDKYIGETEKRLEEVFEKAQKSNMILFFDEADAVMGKRSEVKDAKDKYANTEISFILQRIEEYDGIVILATNNLQNIDSAFMRRIRYVVSFQLPDRDTRKEIWKSSFGSGVPVSEDIDYDFLAEKFELSGGEIKNIVLNAVFYGAAEGGEVAMRHIMKAVYRENTKLKRIAFDGDYGGYAYLLHD